MGGSPRDYFLENLSRWEYDIPYATQWAVRITPVAGVGAFLSNIGTTINVDHYSFQIDPGVMNALFGEQVQGSADGIGLYFAQTISTPEESFSVDAGSPLDGAGGFLQGIVGGNRSAGASRSINIDFLETNLDFVDGIIRPWIITASYNGLIELDKSQSIKADLEMVQYTKGASRPVRKVHSFFNCVPYSVQSNSLDYDSERVIKRTVGWIYNHYTYKLMSGQESGLSMGGGMMGGGMMGGGMMGGEVLGGMVPRAREIGGTIPVGLPVSPPRVVPVNTPANPPRVIPVTERDVITPW